jgi:hypothetical protein
MDPELLATATLFAVGGLGFLFSLACALFMWCYCAHKARQARVTPSASSSTVSLIDTHEEDAAPHAIDNATVVDEDDDEEDIPVAIVCT